MPLYIIASTVVAHVPDINMKAVGYFFTGFLHIKITNTYTYIFEIVPEAYKTQCSSFINILDSMTLAVLGLSFIFLTRDAVYVQ